MPKTGNGSESRFVWRVIDDEVLILDLQSGGFFSLDRVGAEVWTGLQGGLEPAQIVRGIAGRYGVDEQTVQRDVSEFLDQLSREGLME